MIDGLSPEMVLRPTVVIVTDGRATAPRPDPVAAARAALAELAASGAHLVLVDTETGTARLGHVAELAAAVGADYVRLDGEDPAALERGGASRPSLEHRPDPLDRVPRRT